MPRQIMVAVDLEAPFATALVNNAQEFADMMGDHLHVLYVMQPTTGGFFNFKNSATASPLTDEERNALSEKWLARLNTELDKPLTEDELYIRRGAISETINAGVDALNIELLLIGAESRTSLGQLFDGGNGSGKITRTAPCDVLIIGKDKLGLA